MFTILDHGEVVTVEFIRKMFERMVNGTSKLKAKLSLVPLEEVGIFAGYADQITDGLFLGFCLGMRFADRIETQGATLRAAQRQEGIR